MIATTMTVTNDRPHLRGGAPHAVFSRFWPGQQPPDEFAQEFARLKAERDAALAENEALKARFGPLLDAADDEPELVAAAVEGAAGQLQVAAAGLKDDLRDELDAPELELDALDAAQASARNLLETMLNVGDARKNSRPHCAACGRERTYHNELLTRVGKLCLASGVYVCETEGCGAGRDSAPRRLELGLAAKSLSQPMGRLLAELAAAGPFSCRLIPGRGRMIEFRHRRHFEIEHRQGRHQAVPR